MENNKQQQVVRAETLIDPDPFSIFLGIVSFLGSLTTIAAYIETKRNQKMRIHEDQNKMLKEVRDLLLSLEVDTMQMEVSLRKLELLLVEGIQGVQAINLSRLTLQFGTCKPLFTLHGYRQFDETMLELNRLTGKSFETTSRIIQRLYNLDVSFSEDLFERLMELQRNLNFLLREELNYEDGFRSYFEKINITKDILRDLRIQISHF